MINYISYFSFIVINIQFCHNCLHRNYISPEGPQIKASPGNEFHMEVFFEVLSYISIEHFFKYFIMTVWISSYFINTFEFVSHVLNCYRHFRISTGRSEAVEFSVTEGLFSVTQMTSKFAVVIANLKLPDTVSIKPSRCIVLLGNRFLLFVSVVEFFTNNQPLEVLSKSPVRNELNSKLHDSIVMALL